MNDTVNGVTTIGLPPGIGDLHWIMTKLQSFKEKNNIDKLKIITNLGWLKAQSWHTYSLDYLGLIPFIHSAESVEGSLPFEYALAGGAGTTLYKNHGGCDYMIEFNSQLEAGVPLKDILPEYNTNFDYPIDRPPAAEKWARDLKQSLGGKFIVLFTASTAGNDIWARKLWDPGDWVQLAQRIHQTTNCQSVLVGGSWDKGYAARVLQLDQAHIILDVVGQTTIPQLFALLREANAVIAYQCGVMMMAVHFRTPAVAFWPIKTNANPAGRFKREFMTAWLPPWAKEIGYYPFAYGDPITTPNGVFDAIRRHL